MDYHRQKILYQMYRKKKKKDDSIEEDQNNIDRLFGIRQHGDKLYIGNTEVFFENDEIYVGKNKYNKTRGLLELIYKKEPNPKFISQDDCSAYTEILNLTNVFRKKYQRKGEIYKIDSNKLKHVILPLISSGEKMKSKKDNLNEATTSGAGILPRFKVARACSTITDYVYWNDPNELVDRLKLLIAEKSAGNNAHINEIHSIIEELREDGYIY